MKNNVYTHVYFPKKEANKSNSKQDVNTLKPVEMRNVSLYCIWRHTPRFNDQILNVKDLSPAVRVGRSYLQGYSKCANPSKNISLKYVFSFDVKTSTAI